MKTGVIILGHGSRASEAREVFAKMVAQIRESVNYEIVKGAAMELAEPNLFQSVEEVVKQEVDKIIITPLFLFPGVHVQKDIPQLIKELEDKYPTIDFKFARNLGVDKKITEVVVERIKEVS